MAQYPPPGPPQYPEGQGYPPPSPGPGYGQAPPGPQGYPPPPPGPGYGQPPQGQQGYPPPPGPSYGQPPPSQYGGPPSVDTRIPPPQQKRGCRGCLFGCLGAFVVVCVLGVIVAAAGIFMFRQAFPTSESFGQATGCAGLRVAITVIEAGMQGSDMSAEERAQAQAMLREARTEFEKNCGPLR